MTYSPTLTRPPLPSSLRWVGLLRILLGSVMAWRREAQRAGPLPPIVRPPPLSNNPVIPSYRIITETERGGRRL